MDGRPGARGQIATFNAVTSGIAYVLTSMQPSAPEVRLKLRLARIHAKVKDPFKKKQKPKYFKDIV